jgi:hypothetical protein
VSLRYPFACAALAAALVASTEVPAGSQSPHPAEEADSVLPLREWIRDGERRDFDWDVDIRRPELRVDQRHEIEVTARVEAGQLGEAETDHDLTMVTIVTDREGAWLGSSPPEQKSLDADLHEESAVDFETYISLIPGRYVVWVALRDETTGKLNVARRETEVDTIGNDPLPEAYAAFPRVEFARVEFAGTLRVRQFSSDLTIPVASSRPLDIELIATLSAPEQWPGGTARHTENILGGLTALSELDLESGSLSIAGLDLLRREIAFEHRGPAAVDRIELVHAFESVNRSAVSVDALMGRSENPAFLRQYVEGRIAEGVSRSAPGPASGESLRVLIIVAGVMRFEDDPDLRPLELEGPCDCRVFHLRFKQNPMDLFDQVDDLLEPLDPPTFDILTPREFRNVIARIVADLARS